MINCPNDAALRVGFVVSYRIIPYHHLLFYLPSSQTLFPPSSSFFVICFLHLPSSHNAAPTFLVRDSSMQGQQGIVTSGRLSSRPLYRDMMQSFCRNSCACGSTNSVVNTDNIQASVFAVDGDPNQKEDISVFIQQTDPSRTTLPVFDWPRLSGPVFFVAMGEECYLTPVCEEEIGSNQKMDSRLPSSPCLDGFQHLY